MSRFVMPSLLKLVVTAATVMHLSFGCCLHPAHSAHRGSEDACCGRTAAVCNDDACCVEAHAADAASHACDGTREGHEHGDDLAAAAVIARTHACDGCSCVVTEPDSGPRILSPLTVCGYVESVDSDTRVGGNAASGRRRGTESSSYGAGRLRALFERFLV
ncbi:MAG: hypothetical protein WCH77_11365 [Planctomycetota bacterium]